MPVAEKLPVLPLRTNIYIAVGVQYNHLRRYFSDTRKPGVSGGKTSFPTSEDMHNTTFLSADHAYNNCFRVDGIFLPSPQSCCVAAACLSRTRDLETHLAPLATTLVEINLPNEASVDCVAFFLQVTVVL